MALQYVQSGNIAAKLLKLKDPDFTPLMAQWMAIMKEDNIRGVMAGTDKDDKPLIPVKYRNGIAAPEGKRNRFSRGIGLPVAVGSVGENLTTAKYKKLTGPPLAPRGKNSRVIRNFVTRFGRTAAVWFAEGAWINILSRRGVSFLPFHLEGMGNNPKRDIAGVRAWGRNEALNALRREVNRLLRNQ